ncbi:hypothetical protein L2D08_09225 [Domibacillus sp. PGB-M46]|nr:hypothetical protein [Domibacillus sp. PGB-M46]MCI2254547.1 hypothetical protein [Domibacillus sp. PGB-M46]
MTVQDIAAQFGIHPNVARLHLTKLEGVNLIGSCLQKTGKGGRFFLEAETKGTVSSLPNKKRPQLLKTLNIRIGYTAHAKEVEKGLVVQFAIYNCPFKELLQEKDAAACRIHKAVFKGVMETLFAAILSQYSTMLNRWQECIYQSVAVN